MSEVAALLLRPGTVVHVWWQHDAAWHIGVVKELQLAYGAPRTCLASPLLHACSDEACRCSR